MLDDRRRCHPTDGSALSLRLDLLVLLLALLALSLEHVDRWRRRLER
jgi:hypothetical protein